MRTALALVVAFGWTAAARAQPCGGYDDVTLGDARMSALERDLPAALAAGDDARARPLDRVEAYARALALVGEIDRAYGLCSRPIASEEARFRALGVSPTSPVLFRRSIVDRCTAVVRRAHLSGDGAHACIAAVEDVRVRGSALDLPRPQPPRRWATAADPTAEHDAIVRELRARPRDVQLRLDLARIQLASLDPEAAIRTLRPLGEAFDAALLRAIARYGIPGGADPEGRLVATMRALAARAPARIEPHVVIAEAWCGNEARCAEALEHALLATCLARDVEPRSRAARRVAHLVYLSDRPNPWSWAGAGEPPTSPLPAEALGRDAPALADRMPVAETCDAVLARHGIDAAVR